MPALMMLLGKEKPSGADDVEPDEDDEGEDYVSDFETAMSNDADMSERAAAMKRFVMACMDKG